MNIGLIAHDAKKKLMQNFCGIRFCVSRERLLSSRLRLWRSLKNRNILKSGHMNWQNFIRKPV